MKKTLILTIIAVVLCGCAGSPPSSNLQKIILGQDKNSVVKKVGNPRVVRGAVRNKYGQDIEVWEYRFSLPSDDSAGDVIGKSILTICTLGAAAQEFTAETRDYWLYFLDDELVKWGQAGDWQIESKNIYEIRFASAPSL